MFFTYRFVYIYELFAFKLLTLNFLFISSEVADLAQPDGIQWTTL